MAHIVAPKSLEEFAAGAYAFVHHRLATSGAGDRATAIHTATRLHMLPVHSEWRDACGSSTYFNKRNHVVRSERGCVEDDIELVAIDMLPSAGTFADAVEV